MKCFIYYSDINFTSVSSDDAITLARGLKAERILYSRLLNKNLLYKFNDERPFINERGARL